MGFLINVEKVKAEEKHQKDFVFEEMKAVEGIYENKRSKNFKKFQPMAGWSMTRNFF